MLYSKPIRFGTNQTGEGTTPKPLQTDRNALLRAAHNRSTLSRAPLAQTETEVNMKKLEIPLHPKLESIFGYPGNAPKVVFYWEPQADKLMYDDGLETGSANSWAYLIWAAHPSVQSHLSNAGQPMLLLERRERKLYSVAREEALEALKGSSEGALSAPHTRYSGISDFSLHGQPTENYGVEPTPWKEAQQLLADFVIWLGANPVAKKAA